MTDPTSSPPGAPQPAPGPAEPYQPPPPFAPPPPAYQQYPAYPAFPSYPDGPSYPAGSAPTWYPPPPSGAPAGSWTDQYGPFPWPGAPAFPLPPAPSSTGRRLGIAGAIALGAVVILIGTLIVVRRGSSPSVGSRRVTAPQSFGSYTKVNSAAADAAAGRARDAMVGQSSLGSAIANDAVISLYGATSSASGSRPDLVLIANDAHNPSVATLLRSGSPSANTNAFMVGAGYADATEQPAGKLGGSLRCGMTSPDEPYPACVWIDSSSFGFVLSYGDVSVAYLATTTVALRTAAEH